MVERNREARDTDRSSERSSLRSEEHVGSQAERAVREAALIQLLGSLPKDVLVFEIAVAKDGIAEPEVFTRPSKALGISRDKLRDKVRHVVETGNPLSYREGKRTDEVRTWWRVQLVPVKEGDRVVSLYGCAREEPQQRLTSRGVRKEDVIHQRLVELLPDAVIFTDTVGRILYINAAGVKLLGATVPEEVLNQSVWDVIHPEDLLRARERGRLVKRGERVDLVEHKLVRRDGSIIDIETVSVPVRYRGKRAILTTARDISGRKRLEQALTESQELFYKAFLAAPAAYSITRAADGTVIDANDAYIALTGYDRDELIGKTTVDLDLWPDPQERSRIRDDVMSTGAVYGRELSLRRKDGAIRKLITSIQRLEVNGEASFIAVAVDVTERERAAEAERESRDLLYRIFHASPAAIAIIRLSDGRFMDVNDHWCWLTEYDAEHIVGKTISDVALWDQEGIASSSIGPDGAQGAVHDFEMAIRTRSGQERTVLASFQQIQVKGEPCLLTVLTDITDRKAMELELVRSKVRAEEMSRIKTAFLTNMTHEVRTPLTVILGFTSMLRQGVRDEYQRFVRVIERSGRRLLLMLDSILDLAQLEGGSLAVDQQMFNVVDVVRNEADSFRPVAEEKGLRFNLKLPSERAHVRSDHKIFIRVLNNVFDNAVKFTEEGTITLSVDADDENVRTIIDDTGIGIDTAFLPRIFDEFSQESTGLERTHQGSGLGLAVSKRLLELVGGTIQVESRKGRGSRFVISLPRATNGDR